MLSRTGRPFAQVAFGPVARLFVELGVGANIVTVVGTILSSAVALGFILTNHLITAALLGTAVFLFDNLDGQIARMTGTSSKWGSFLDSCLDRVSDAAIFAALTFWGYLYASDETKVWIMAGAVAAGLLGTVVPYTRAKAESLGYMAAVGLAERADRLVFSGIIVLLVGLGLTEWIMAIGLWLLAIAAFVTIIQRFAVVHKQILADEAHEHETV